MARGSTGGQRQRKPKTRGAPGAQGPSPRRPWTHVPRLVVFDLDFTLWHPEMYELDGAPFAKDRVTGAVTDRAGEEVRFFPAVHAVLSVLTGDRQFREAGTEIAVASKTTEPQWAKTCMRLMDVELRAVVDRSEEEQGEEAGDADTDATATSRARKASLQSLVDYEAIYPRNKRVHFQQLHEQSGVAYEDMLFFDNEYGNIVDVGRMGVVCAYCPQGLSDGAWIQGMEAFQKAKADAATTGHSAKADTDDY